MIVFWMKEQKNIEPGDIRTMSKYPRKMDEVIDAMDLIVVVWRANGLAESSSGCNLIQGIL
jgi:hypothetical protein